MGLVSRLRRRIQGALKKPKTYPVLYNVNGANESSLHKRALLAYLTQAFVLPEGSPDFLKHQNLRQCQQIASLLGEFGYIVDVVDIRDQAFKPDHNYDLVLRDRLRAERFEPDRNDITRLFLATTMDHSVHNRNLRRRHQWLSERRGDVIPIKRLFIENLPYAVEADAIIGFGNEYILKTWQHTSKARTYSFNNYGFPGTRFIWESKKFAEARKKFLFFASGTQVQKGLDLLLEIFPRLPDLDLYVCSSFEQEKEAEFRACYRKELFETPNIHPVGWVTVNSSQFYELAERCAYVINPSCSEGQSGAVVQCMHAGLIPIVTRESGIDTNDFGVTFVDDTLEEIEKTIMHLAGLPESWHREHSLKTRKIAEEQYSEVVFLRRWREILSEVLPRGN
jgi:glycosyltransferase involved in cell wall biosynthesis